jgi:hypothetical protein
MRHAFFGVERFLFALALAGIASTGAANAGSFREALREKAKEAVEESEHRSSDQRRHSDDKSKKSSSHSSSKKSSSSSKDRDDDHRRHDDRDDHDDHRDHDHDNDRDYDYDHRRYYSHRPYSNYGYGYNSSVVYPRSYYYSTPRYYYNTAPAPVIYPSSPYRSDYGVSSSYYDNVSVQVQSRLSALGYYRGAIDGIIGSGSRSAIRGFQIDNELPVTGRIDGYLLRALGLNR